jgi:hypothetical protein
MTEIRELRPDGEIVTRASYSLEPYRALLCFKRQFIHKDYNTWDYPDSDPEIHISNFGNPYFEHRESFFGAYKVKDTNQTERISA